MRIAGWISTTFFVSTGLSIETERLPFSPPQPTGNHARALDVLRILKRSDNNCPAGHNPCTNMDSPDVCCKQGSRCSRDANDHIACCPTGASCTGSLPTSSNSDGNSFKFPSTASATHTTGANDATLTGSTIQGEYPFVNIPTSFPNGGVCSSYYSLCQSEYTGCLSKLGGGYAVTVGGEGGGVTREGAPSAVATCSSLSMEACHGLHLGYCDTHQTAHDDGNRAPAGRTSSLQDLFFGMLVSVAGMLI